ncbi:MAG: ankyrin repeat domain-containing protein [Synergistaceae bacterium]|nr:ankyrin repeat domain-containing protein [Synergistaceae bacterium]
MKKKFIVSVFGGVSLCALFAGYLLFINYLTSKRDSDFIELCKSASYNQIADAIKGGANVNARDEYGRTPIMWAAEWNSNPEVITVLVNAGADVNTHDETEYLPLLSDTDEGQSSSSSQQILRNTPLMYAAFANPTPEVIMTLIKAGADVNVKNTEGYSPIMQAAQSLYPNPEVITALINAGADVNAKNNDGITALMLAAMMDSNTEVMTTLIKAGADVNAQIKNGATALVFAVMLSTPNPEAIITLLELGANPKLKNHYNGKIAIDIARENKSLENVEALRMLEEASR